MAGHPNPKFYTYILQSIQRPDIRYTGHTADLKQRLADHNAGKCTHSSANRPWRIYLYVAFQNVELARDVERYLKSGSGHAFAHRHFGC